MHSKPDFPFSCFRSSFVFPRKRKSKWKFHECLAMSSRYVKNAIYACATVSKKGTLKVVHAQALFGLMTAVTMTICDPDVIKNRRQT